MFEFRQPDMALQARRDILNLRPGTQIPGYTGHRPGVKHGFGNTYGHQTRLSYIDQFESTEDEEPNGLAERLEAADETMAIVGCSGDADSRRRFIIPDPKNDSSAVGELLRGGPMPYADFYRIHGRPRVTLQASDVANDFVPAQYRRAAADGGPASRTMFADDYHWTSSHKPIPIADERRVGEKLRLYKAMREQRERLADDSRRFDLQFAGRSRPSTAFVQSYGSD